MHRLKSHGNPLESRSEDRSSVEEYSMQVVRVYMLRVVLVLVSSLRFAELWHAILNASNQENLKELGGCFKQALLRS